MDKKEKKIFKKLFDTFLSRQDVYAECYYDKKQKRYAYKSVKDKYTIDVLANHVKNPKYEGIGIYLSLIHISEPTRPY